MTAENILKFLKGLKQHNEKEWFDKNRRLYETAKKDFEILVNYMISEIGKFDKKVKYITAKDCLFRIFRDVRFSPDKTPYKTNFGAYIAREGRKGGYAGYYIHIEPGASFWAGGVYMPEPDILKAIRTEIYENIDEFKKIINHREFKTRFGEVWGSTLKIPPKGFPADFPDIELLKYKDYSMVQYVTDKEALSDTYTDEMKKAFRAMLPFNDFINRIVELEKGLS